MLARATRPPGKMSYPEGCKRRIGLTCTRPCCVVQRKPESDEEDEENEPPPPPAKQQRISPAPAASSSSSLATVPAPTGDTRRSEVLLGDRIMVGQKVKLNFPADKADKKPYADWNDKEGETVGGPYAPKGLFEVELNPEKGQQERQRVQLKPEYLLPFAPKPIPERPAELDTPAIEFSKSNYRSAGDEAERVFALANEYDEARDADLRGYVAMEKYDGVRAMWEGPQGGFRTRGGGPYA